MPIPVTQFQPMSYQQNAAGVEGMQAGANIANQNLQNQINLTRAMQQSVHQSIVNQAAQNTLPYAAPQAAAQVRLTQGQGAQAQAQAGATGANVALNVIGQMRQLQASRAYGQQHGIPTDMLDQQMNMLSNVMNSLNMGQGNNQSQGNNQNQGGMQQPQSPSPQPMPQSNGATITPQPGLAGNSNPNGANNPSLPTNQQSLPLNPNQISNLGARFGNNSGGVLPTSQNVAQGLQPQPPTQPTAAPASNLTPEESQMAAIKSAQNDIDMGIMYQNPNLIHAGTQRLTNATTGTSFQQELGKKQAAEYSMYQEQANAAGQILPKVKEYQDILNNMSPIQFAIGLNKIGGQYSPEIQHLMVLSKQILPLDAKLTGMQSSQLTDLKYNNLSNASANPGQFYNAIKAELNDLNTMAYQSSGNYNRATDSVVQNRGLTGYQPYALNNDSKSVPNIVNGSLVPQVAQSGRYVQMMRPDGSKTISVPVEKAMLFQTNHYRMVGRPS